MLKILAVREDMFITMNLERHYFAVKIIASM